LAPGELWQLVEPLIPGSILVRKAVRPRRWRTGPLAKAGAGTSVTLLLTDDIDISRGDLIAAADAPPQCSTRPSGPS